MEDADHESPYDDWRDSGEPSAASAPDFGPTTYDGPPKRRRRSRFGRTARICVACGVLALGLQLWLNPMFRNALGQLFGQGFGIHARKLVPDPDDPEQAVARAAVGTELMTSLCINFLPDSVLANRQSYAQWAGRGPTLARPKKVFGISRMDHERGCLEAIAAVQDNPALDAELKGLAGAYGRSFESLIPLVNEAARYYQAHEHERDRFERGSAMHAPLLRAFDAYDRADSALRAALLSRSLAEEPLLVARVREDGRLRERTCNLAVADLRLASRRLVDEGNPPEGDLKRIDRGVFAERLAVFSAALDRLPEACKGREHSYENASRRVLDEAFRLERRLESGARYSARERAAIENGSTDLLRGAPFQLVRWTKHAIASLNNTQLMRAAKQAEVAPRQH